MSLIVWFLVLCVELRVCVGWTKFGFCVDLVCLLMVVFGLLN